MKQTAIRIENVGKLYRLGEVGTGTLSHDLNRWFARIRGKEDPFAKIGEANDRTKKGSSEYVWALQNINLDIEQGTVVGIIGKNGAGKSTLLKLLSKVTAPTVGSISIQGRIASLLEVGTGFHPELSGRENIYLNGAILGMTKREIRRKFDEIVDFAGVERYIDTPVKRYSSGMYVRLAFAVAAHLESEILIVDEVLAVGDAEFQSKCLGRMKDVSVNEGRTVLFVSHNMASIAALCKQGVLMHNGTVACHSDISSVVERYMQSPSGGAEEPVIHFNNVETEELKLESFSITSEEGEPCNTFFSDASIGVQIKYTVKKPTKNLRIIVSIKSQEGIVIFETADVIAQKSNLRQEGFYESELKIPSDLFNVGRYYASVVVDKPSEQKLFGPVDLPFNITDLLNSQIGVVHGGKPDGLIHPKLSWAIKQKLVENV